MGRAAGCGDLQAARTRCHTLDVDDVYRDLAADYEWLFADEIIGGQGEFGATSPGSRALLEGVLGALQPGAPVLDCSCGIGADAMALARRGFAVTASDGSAGMVAETRRRSAQHDVAVAVCQSDWRDLSRQVPGPFDLVVCLGNSIVHADTRAGLVDAVQGMRAVLGPGGTLVVDSRNWERPYSLRPRIVPARRVIGRRGLRCSSLYIWTIPDELDEPCRAEIVLLFEDADSALTGHRRHVIDFGCGSFEVS
jgi:2-polyprenyl-3-methyl-5-hydroxy-6-metoxy-1,4-benzoquinol methylase